MDPKSLQPSSRPNTRRAVLCRGCGRDQRAGRLPELSGGIAGDAKSGTNVLGSVDFDFTTRFNTGALIEIFFPTKVSQVGFWLNPSLGDVELIALDTNFAFSHIPDTNLEVVDSVTAGHFVGIQRPTADIGGFKIEAKGTTGFTIDDFTFTEGNSTTASTTPEPGTLILFGCGLAGKWPPARCLPPQETLDESRREDQRRIDGVRDLYAGWSSLPLCGFAISRPSGPAQSRCHIRYRLAFFRAYLQSSSCHRRTLTGGRCRPPSHPSVPRP